MERKTKLIKFFFLHNKQEDDTVHGAGTFSWEDPVHSWKAGPGEVMTVENKQTEKDISNLVYLSGPNQYECQILYRGSLAYTQFWT